jgi:CSLREA domain-containing protein
LELNFNKRRTWMTRLRSVFVFVIAIGAMLALAEGAGAATTITVNNSSDITPVDDGNCTLREAVTAANTDTASGATTGECAAGSGTDAIHFNIGSPFEIQLLGTGFDQITESVTIDGCSGANASDPCVGVIGGNSTPFDVDANGVAIKGLSLTGSSGTVPVLDYQSGNTGLQVKNNWFGVTLAGTASDIGSAIELRGNSAQIGGTTAAERNVISRTNAAGGALRVISGDNNVVSGNYFGTEPDGAPTGGFNSSGPNIKLVGNASGNDKPAGTVIGGTPSAAQAASGACDGPCNLIANSNSSGIVMEDGGVGESEAGQTTIKGNYIGLGVNGTTDAGNGFNGVRVGAAEPVTIGGPTAADRNYFAGNGDEAIDASADGLTIRNNFLGLNFAGTTTIADQSPELNLTGVAGDPITIRDNRVGFNGPFGISLGGSGATVTGNTIGVGTGGQDVGADTAINVPGSGNAIGGTGPGDGNVVGNTDTGITVNGGSGSTFVGNKVGTNATETQAHPITGSGIIVNGSDSNTIGGTSAAGENVIENVGADAILVLGDGTDFNAILRNRGSAASNEQFIDLTPNFGPGNNLGGGANEEAQAPTVDAATSQTISGSDTSAGDTVRVYRTLTNGDPSNIEAFVGQTTSDGSGNWTLNCPGAGCAAELPGNGLVTANATDGAGNSSELAQAKDYTAVAPNTTINSGPAQGSTTSDPTPTFGFSSNESSASFQCKVDGGSFSSCSSPRTTSSLSNGSHSFQVRAKDTANNLDPSPASRSFTVDTSTAPDTKAPDTEITKGPKKKVKTKKSKAKVKFEFSSEANASFECSLDDAAFEPCTSPDKEKVKKGKHSFAVRAKDAAGNVDQSPAEQAFKVKRKKK